MLASRKLRLKPTKEQEIWLNAQVGVARFIYNWSLSYKIEQHKNFGISVGQSEVMREITDMKYIDEFLWLQEYSSETVKQAVKDMLRAYKNFFQRGCRGHPKFKKKGRCKESFYVRYDRLYSYDDKYLVIPNLKTKMKVSESCVIVKGSIKNPRISFDGKYWYLSYSYEVEPLSEKLTNEVIGIDLGIKDLAVRSNGVSYRNINKDFNIQKFEMRKRRLQRKLSRMYEKNKQGNKFIKTSNIRKLEHKIRLIDRKLSNARKTYIHTVTMQIVKTKPSCIVLEDSNIRGILKNKYLAKSIQGQLWYFFRQCIEYKSQFYDGIEVMIAKRNYPSSKKCSNCGHIKKFLSLSNRTYICNKCGLKIDMDLNASYNLRNLAFSL